MRPSRGRALVLGLGRFGGGREAARFLGRRGWTVRIADKAGADALAEATASLADLPRVEWCLGREDEALLQGVDLLVVNPAIPDGHALLAAASARGVAATQEVDLFLDHYPGRVVLVTGTNGKSTTTTLIAAAIARSGRPMLVGGNVGHSLLADEPRWAADQTAVLEISSFQLERLAAGRSVHGAVFTRVTRDHLDRHGTLQRYHAAKARAADAATGFVVHAADDPVAAAFTTRGERLVHACEPAAGAHAALAAWVDGDGWLVLGGRHPGRLAHRRSLRLVGAFQSENVLGAGIAALELGATHHAAGLAFALARPLPHRLQLIAEVGGVRVFDNGVSTEIQSTQSAIRSVAGPLHWVGGGKSKDGDFRTVADALAGHIASAHVFGAAAEPLGREFHARDVIVPHTRHERLEGALAAAFAAAAPGDAVLFSPAFASFDQYRNFKARAEAFHEWLRAHRADR